MGALTTVPESGAPLEAHSLRGHVQRPLPGCAPPPDKFFNDVTLPVTHEPGSQLHWGRSVRVSPLPV